MEEKHRDNIIKSLGAYSPIMKRYHYLISRFVLSDVEADELESILEKAVHDSELDFLLEEIERLYFNL